MNRYDCVIVGTGEIGRPLFELMNGVFKVLPINRTEFKDNSKINATCDFLHFCLPGEMKNFNGVILNYIDKYRPTQVLIHSTVIPGTCESLNRKLAGPLVVHTPVHGKHQGNRMKSDMLRYPKYVGVSEDLSDKAIEKIRVHLTRMGFPTVVVFRNTGTTEWAKVLATTIFGLQVSFAQEVERICDKFNLNYDEVTHFFPIQEDARGPIYAGFIGGHCVMPNIAIIKDLHDSPLLDWMQWSNERKRKRDNIEVDNRGR